MGSVDSVTVVCPINIALIKYWGKKDINLNLPLNSSISITLDTEYCYTKTTVERLETLNGEKTTFTLNGKDVEIKEGSRIDKILRYVSKYEIKCYRICSVNSFPTAAGMASSASGYAALALCFGKLCNMKPNDVAVLARLGSGSACRSLFGGFVEWVEGSSPIGVDSLPIQLYDKNYWDDICIISLICSHKMKEYSSTTAMIASGESSDFLKYRVTYQVNERISALKLALERKSFQQLGKIIMKESNSFHAICQDTYPPITPPYLNEFSYSIIRLISWWNTKCDSIQAAYTFDAGPNAFLILPKNNVNIFFNLLITHILLPSHHIDMINYNYNVTIDSTKLNIEIDNFDKDLFTYIQNGFKQLKTVIFYKIGDGPYFC